MPTTPRGRRYPIVQDRLDLLDRRHWRMIRKAAGIPSFGIARVSGDRRGVPGRRVRLSHEHDGLIA
jgi:hypothetical protein